MNGKVLLDTNIVIALFSQDHSVHDALSRTVEVFVPSIVLGELYYGAYKSVEVGPNITRIGDFARQNAILSCDGVTAQYCGRVKSFLRLKGRPIPENDIWIAAIAQQYSLTLLKLTVLSEDEPKKPLKRLVFNVFTTQAPDLSRGLVKQ